MTPPRSFSAPRSRTASNSDLEFHRGRKGVKSIQQRSAVGSRHRRDPLAHERNAFLVHEPLAELGHHDAGVGRGDAEGQDRLVGLAGHDVEGSPPEPMPAATGGLLMPKDVGLRCEASRSSPEFAPGPRGCGNGRS